MSSSQKHDPVRAARRSHVTRRHGAAPPAEVVPADALLHALAPPPGAAPAEAAAPDAPAVDRRAARAAWSRLGAELAALGPHRLAIAARAAVAAAGGGRDVSAEEEAALARWFAGVVDEALRRGGLPAGAAIWLVLAGDSHDGPFEARMPRCPAVAAVPPPGTAGEPAELAGPAGTVPDPAAAAAFFGGLRAAAAGYVHTALACASPADVLELREIARADDDALEDYRPWGIDLAEAAPAWGGARARAGDADLPPSLARRGVRRPRRLGPRARRRGDRARAAAGVPDRGRGVARARGAPGGAVRARPAARRLSREEQLLELRDHIHARDRRVLDALITVFSEAKLEPRVLAAVGVLVRFGVQMARQPGRRRS